jgi:outer membrane protein OmpA-like peptidoglycan-associated protein
VIISLAGPDQVTVASVAPLILQLTDFNLIGGRNKLQETAEVTITPATAITFALAFKRNSASPVAQPLLASLDTSNVALEPVGNLSAEACEGRFEILSRAGNIYFDKGSDQLKPESSAFIASIGAILSKCPGMVVEVGGHTDSAGSDAYNLTLSERRAQSVVQNLMHLGLKDSFLIARGYGETQPVASNGTFEGRSRNRRIEFRVLGRTALDG